MAAGDKVIRLVLAQAQAAFPFHGKRKQSKRRHLARAAPRERCDVTRMI